VGTRSFRPTGRPRQAPVDTDALIRETKTAGRIRRSGYRERSLEVHGWLCAKCGRDFDASNLHLLTVHHKDGNHANNPSDGSNWENLCVYCHEAEHTTGLLGDYLTRKD